MRRANLGAEKRTGLAHARDRQARAIKADLCPSRSYWQFGNSMELIFVRQLCNEVER